jgi:glycerol-3-phosphate cytidylyltransferase-like family protein
MSGEKKRGTLSLSAIEGQLLPEELTYQAKLRDAMYGAINEDDVTQMAKVMVAKAKQGDVHAVKWVTDYLVGLKNKPTKVEIHNHYPDVVASGRSVEREAREALNRKLAQRRNGAPVGLPTEEE